MRLPSGREVEVSELSYGAALDLRKRVGDSPLEFQLAALRALVPDYDDLDLDRLDLHVIVKEVDRIVAGRTPEDEPPFREQLAAHFGGHEIGYSEALGQLAAYRWCGLLGWTYGEVASTPTEVLPLCLKFRWTRQQLMETPAHAIRDFLTIFQYETEAASKNAGV